ncbi:MAG TPA: hypothetical protein VJT10_23175 [Steroidobacteraceae bacterium]|jgi:hypothetical protein|nr:hypothetical protein [Steroidobacteraceae bacterium]
MPATQHAHCGMRAQLIKCAIAVVALTCGTMVHAATHLCQEEATTGTTPEQRFARLVCIRARAIQTAIGPLFDGRDLDIRIEFAGADDAQYPQTSMSSYDPAAHTLYFRRKVLWLAPEAWYQLALAYWPYYRDVARATYPLIGIVDEALWNAHLRQAAHEHGLSWPSEDCGEIDIARRLGCEMLVSATVELSQSPATPMVNANRVDLLWPEDLKDFERRAWTRGGREYREVRRLGGLLLLEPLVREFGAPRVFAYAARTPFRIENNNVRLSALRYQDGARKGMAM